MKKRLLITVLIGILVMTTSIWNISFADDLESQMEEINAEKEEVSSEMEELTADIEAAQEDVDAIQVSIDAKESEISDIEAEIEQLKVDMTNREEGLNDRLRTMYKNGSVGYLDVLLGSKSISEFLNNLTMIQRIYKNDQDTLKTMEDQHDLLEEKQNALNDEKESLATQQEEMSAKQATLEDSKEKLQAKLDALNAEADNITAEIKARQEALSNQNGGNGGGNYSGGALMWPCDSTYITSEFGYRIHPLTGIYTGHTGIDIGCSMNSPIYAAESGTVILSQWYGGYGYAVVVDHGGGVTTLYGHNDYLIAKEGDKVSRGEVIASSGNTGWSTGPHLHFEVRVDGDYVDPMNYF